MVMVRNRSKARRSLEEKGFQEEEKELLLSVDMTLANERGHGRGERASHRGTRHVGDCACGSKLGRGDGRARGDEIRFKSAVEGGASAGVT